MSRSEGAGGLADVIAAQGGERIRFSCSGRTIAARSSMATRHSTKRRRPWKRFIASSSDSRKSPSSGSSICRLPTTRKAGDAVLGDDPLLKAMSAPAGELPGEDGRRLQHGRGDRRTVRSGPRAQQVRRSEAKLEEHRSDVKDSQSCRRLVQATHGPPRAVAIILGLFRSTPAKRGGGRRPRPEADATADRVAGRLADEKGFCDGRQDSQSLTEIGITLEDRKGGATEWRVGGPS